MIAGIVAFCGFAAQPSLTKYAQSVRRHPHHRGRTHTKTRAVFARRQAGDFLEGGAKSAGVLVTHRPGDVVDSALGELQQFARLADPQVLAVLRRLKPRGGAKTPQERALLQARALRHRCHRHIHRAIALQPMLDLEHRPIAMGNQVGRLNIELVGLTVLNAFVNIIEDVRFGDVYGTHWAVATRDLTNRSKTKRVIAGPKKRRMMNLVICMAITNDMSTDVP